MRYYAHGVSDNRWLGNNFFELKGETITIDLQCLNNEWSAYLIENLNDRELIDKIALQFFTECNRNIDTSVALVLFSTEFLNRHNLKEPDENDFDIKKDLNLYHCNIRSKNNFIRVQCVIDVGQDLFDVFNSESTNSELPVRFYSPLTIASIIKKNKEAFKSLLSGNDKKIQKMISFFSSIADMELNDFLSSISKKKK